MNQSKNIIVNVSLRVEVDRSSWRVNYGGEADRDNEVRDEIRATAEYVLQEALRLRGVEATVALKEPK